MSRISALGFSRALVLIALVSTLTSCGRYGSPLPPEAFTASQVEDLTAEATAAGVKFVWGSPTDDRQGDTLADLERFDVMRTETTAMSDFLKDPIGESEVIGRVYTSHIALLEEKREAAREQKKSIRSIKIPESLSTFTFTDTSVESGKSYIYSVVPIGSENLPGQVVRFVKVDFVGEESITRTFTQEELDRPFVLGLSPEAVEGADEEEEAPVEDLNEAPELQSEFEQ